jgi:hypothetical protein
LIAEPLEAAVTHKASTTEFIALGTALDHVEAREGTLAERLLVRALAEGLPARGYVIHLWPPYQEGHEQLDPELFCSYGPQAPPARIERDGSAELRGWGHPHFECRVLNIEVNRQAFLQLWSGPLKPAKSRRPSVQRLVKDFEKSGRPVSGVTHGPDGTTIHFGEGETGEAETEDTPERIISQL